MDKQFCKFEHRCSHEKMGLVYCFQDIPQSVEKCLLYVLMEDREKDSIKKEKKHVQK